MSRAEQLVPPLVPTASRARRTIRLLTSENGLNVLGEVSTITPIINGSSRAIGFYEIGSGILLDLPADPKGAATSGLVGALLMWLPTDRTARLNRAIMNPPSITHVESSLPENDRPTVTQTQEFAQMVKLFTKPDVVGGSMEKEIRLDESDGPGTEPRVKIEAAVKFDQHDGQARTRRHLYNLRFELRVPNNENIYEYLDSIGYKLNDYDLSYLSSWTARYSDINLVIKGSTEVADVKGISIDGLGKGTVKGNLTIEGFRPYHHKTAQVFTSPSEFGGDMSAIGLRNSMAILALAI